MKIAFITFGHIDVSLPLLKYISKKVDIDLYLIFAKDKKGESIINFEGTNVWTGFIDRKIINVILGEKMSKYIDASFEHYIFIYKNLKFKSLSNIVLSYQLSKVLKKRKYDIVHFNGQHGVLPQLELLLVGKPQIYSIHDFEGHSGEKKWFPEVMNKLTLFIGKQIIVKNKKTFNEIVEKFPKLEGKINYIPFGVLEIYKFFGNKNIPEKKNSILFFGRISPYKGIEYLVNAVPIIKKTIPDLKVIIAGNGKFYFDIEPIRNDNTYEIINRYIPNKELVELIQRSTLVVCPYTDATQSGVIMTAYAFNKPVVASSVGGIPEVVEDNVTGKLMPPRNPRALAEAIIDLLSNPKKRKQMKKNIEKKCSKGKLSWDYIARQTIEVYKKAIKSKNL